MARKTQVPPKSFEEALRELEQILSDIEAGELGLEESLVKYERREFPYSALPRRAGSGGKADRAFGQIARRRA